MSADDHIDPQALAQFMLAPGAARLVRAFSAIPGSRLRETAISHVEAIAEAFLQLAPFPPPGPPESRLEARRSRLALTPPRAPQPAQDGPEARAVALMLQALTPAATAEQTGLSMAEVLEARRLAQERGIQFPRVAMTQVVTGERLADETDAADIVVVEAADPRPQPPAPRHRASPGSYQSAETIRAIGRRPSERQGDLAFPLTVAEAGFRAAARWAAAAERIGTDAEGWARLRQEAVLLVRKDRSPAQIAAALGVRLNVAKEWRRQIILAGLDKASPAPPRSGPQHTPNVAFPLVRADLADPQVEAHMREAAQRVGMALTDYLAFRNDFVRRLNAGETVAQINMSRRNDRISIKTLEAWRLMAIAAGLIHRRETAT